MSTLRKRWPAVLAVVAALMVATAATAAMVRPDPGDGGPSADAVAATAGFRSLPAAKSAGYALLRDKDGIACIAMAPMPGMPAGAMGVHFVKSALVADPAIDAKTPEALVYAPDGSRLRLAAVEYVVLQKAWDAAHSSPPRLFGRTFALTPDGNRYGLPAFYSLHAWIWKYNPSGMFSMWNPDVKCP
jgi:hypothetical protein